MGLIITGTGAALVAGPRTKKGNFMRTVEITRATIAKGLRVTPGDLVKLPEHQAAELIAMGKAIPVIPAPEPENREADVEAKISKRAAPKKKTKKGE